jgi:pilus assembly protein CpaB
VSAKLKVLIASLCLAGSVGVVILVLARSAPSSEPHQTTYIPQATVAVDGPAVVVATGLVGRGERISAGKLTLRRIEGPVLGSPLTSVDSAVDAVALNTIQAGQVIMAGDVAKGADAHPGLSVLVPDGMRAVALRVNDEIAVGNFVSPGDRVDIQVVFSAKQAAQLHDGASVAPSTEAHVLLQDIEVLSAGETLMATNDGRAIRMQTITVSVKPRDAQLLAVAKETGSFYLALRNPTDRGTTELPAVSADDLATDQGLPLAARSKPTAVKTAHRVQVIEGQASSMRTVLDE